MENEHTLTEEVLLKIKRMAPTYTTPEPLLRYLRAGSNTPASRCRLKAPNSSTPSSYGSSTEARYPGEERRFVAIDLKSFYASVECVDRGLNPIDTCLVVADASRTNKTICLAVSPPLKKLGLGGRPRLFEVIQHLRRVNRGRGHAGSSYSARCLDEHPEMAVDYIVAPPRMARYIAVSSRIYEIYLRYVAPEDIHVYSIDEVMIDVTAYLRFSGLQARELAEKMVHEVMRETGITATAGIGSNLYLAKVAMDILAKKMTPDAHGVRIAELTEASYRALLWDHLPLTDFWRVGRGIARRLQRFGIFTMGDIARCSVRQEGLLYDLFGINAELLIDHAWGWEPVEIADIKSYRPERKSLGIGQVLTEPYPAAHARTVIREMADTLALDLMEKGLTAAHLTIHAGYDSTSLNDPAIASRYDGPISIDFYGRKVPYHARGSVALPRSTSSATEIMAYATALFDRIINPILLVRRLNITADSLAPYRPEEEYVMPPQLSLFTDYEAESRRQTALKAATDKEHRRQQAILNIKRRFGKNAILRGLNYADGATQRTRNVQIGGHHE